MKTKKSFNDLYYEIKSTDCSELIKSYKKDMFLKIFFTILFIIFVFFVFETLHYPYRKSIRPSYADTRIILPA